MKKYITCSYKDNNYKAIKAHGLHCLQKWQNDLSTQCNPNQKPNFNMYMCIYI